MLISKLKIICKDPILVLILLTMVSSTVVSLFLVKKNNFNIDILESEIRDKKVRIYDISETVNQKHSQVTSLVLLGFIAQKDNKDAELVKMRYLQVLPNINKESSAMEILDVFERYRSESLSQIDDIYIEQISLESQKEHLEQRNKFYAAIATLLQAIGLAFIIVRKDVSSDSLY